MKNNASLVYAFFLIIGDALALIAAFVAAYILRVKFDPRPLIEQIPAPTYLRAFLTVLPFWILVHALIGLYNQEVYEKRFSEFGRLLVGSFLGILVVIGFDFVTGQSLFPARLVPVYGLGIGFGFLVLFRTLARGVRRLMFKYGVGIGNILVIGDTSATMDIVNIIRDTRTSGQKILGIVGKDIPGLNHYKSFTEAIEHLRRPIHGIIQTELHADQAKNNEIFKYARENHAAYRFVPGNTDLFVGNISVELFAGGLPVIVVHQTALTGWGRIVKRLFDLVLTTVILFFIWPFLLLLALLVKLSDPKAPVFLRQIRLTRFDSQFRVFKFRTHISKYNGLSPEEAFKKMGKPQLIKTYRENGDYLPNDPRVSRIGRVLRRTSLDELPQLFNIFSGNLSLVGPRALVPEELNAFAERHAILSVKSGLTGLAQISGRKDISFEERRKLDIYYVQNWSFWFDIVILLKTLRVVLLGKGAK